MIISRKSVGILYRNRIWFAVSTAYVRKQDLGVRFFGMTFPDVYKKIRYKYKKIKKETREH